MSSRSREVEITISSAKDIKNVNWRNGPNKPYAVLWVDPKYKSPTTVDEDGDTCPYWNETFVIPLPPEDDDVKVYVDIVHAGREANTKKPIIGSAHLSLRDVGFGVSVVKTLKLKRPSGRPHGKLDVAVTVREHLPYGYTQQQPFYGGYNDGTSGYGYAAGKEKGSDFDGMGTGLAVGAVAGALGGVAIAEGMDAVEDDIAEEAAEKADDDYDAGVNDFGVRDDNGGF